VKPAGPDQTAFRLERYRPADAAAPREDLVGPRDDFGGVGFIAGVVLDVDQIRGDIGMPEQPRP
jgi:hypothetical protein